MGEGESEGEDIIQLSQWSERPSKSLENNGNWTSEQSSARIVVCVDAGEKILSADLNTKIACPKSHFGLDYMQLHLISFNVYETNYFVKIEGVN